VDAGAAQLLGYSAEMPVAEPVLHELIEGAYDAVLDSDRLDALLGRLRRQLSASASLLFRVPHGGNYAVFNSANLDPSAHKAYAAYYGRIDPFLHEATSRGLFRPGRVWTGDSQVPDEVLLRSEFYADFWRPQQVGRVLVASLGNADAEATLSLYRPPGAELFGEEAVLLLRDLAPHLRRALRLQARLEGRAGPLTLALLDQLPWGVFFIDASLRVVQVNAAGEEILRQRDGLMCLGGRLLAASRMDHSRLQAALARAIGGKRSGADLTIARPSGLRPWLVSLAPLGSRFYGLFSVTSARAFLYVVDPEARLRSEEERLQAFYGLTRAETRLAVDLLRGLTLANIAELHGLSSETVRSQLKSLFAKTETNRQSELLALLVRSLSLP
jgi:DNA-binding CsgD family transcriptional regulator